MTISIDDTIVGRIERLEARAAIERLMADYAFGCDQKDAQRFLGVFHDDAEYVGPTAATVGHEAIRETIRQIWQMLPETHHWITNVTVDITGVDSASGEAHVITYGRGISGVEGFLCAVYRNQYERRDGVWKAASIALETQWFKQVEFGNPQTAAAVGGGSQPR
jgi:uncharacterized protein (TIGR02246 family)